MAIEQSAPAAGVAAATAGLIQIAPPIAYGDFGWMVVAALIGIAFKHASGAADDRLKMEAGLRATGQPVNRKDLPTIDWTALMYDAYSAPALAILGWVGAALAVKWLWKVDVDPRGLFVAAMMSGFLGATWVRFAWTTIQRVVTKRTGG